MNAPAYPHAYCVKCRTHTNTKEKHTVLLQNNARALTGVCPDCASQVYKFMPRKKQKTLSSAPKLKPNQQKTHYSSPNFSLDDQLPLRDVTYSSGKTFDYTTILWGIIAFTSGIIVMALMK